ncbi:uncharacterized protein N7496_010725 [Penicillium cataractarum]|uniref:FTP domain-containing protein n=1 Tax=Penicillium cataractarum TaxID=2100454 RepID=A0A9W9RDL9_9EURO|nr:uncharacterized protein N7496_010725 [Penicillium cataractarum]KAJ5358312.1 hypothetical protein N7496_010725 [Penicillium cataractarum]
MSFDRDPNVEVLWSPETGLHGPSDPISVAHQYLLRVADDYKIPPGVLGETPTKLSELASSTDALFSLSLPQERPRFRSTAVIYQQTLCGLPVWDAKFSVTVNKENHVVNSTSSIDIRASKPETPQVFARDPATKLGHKAPTTSGDIADLNLLGDKVFLSDIIPTTPQKLNGRYAEIKDFDLPISLPPTTASGGFNDSVETDNFTAVSAYYHITKLFRLLAELGFPVKTFFINTQFPFPVDHRGFNDMVSAQAPGNSTGNGCGGFIFGRADRNTQIGIAADFRVATHEFGHALLWDAIHWPGFGFAHSPGDSLAAIYCDPRNDAQDRFDTFPWSVVRRRHDREVTDGWAWDGPQYRRDGPAYYLHARGDFHKQNWASRYTLYLIIGGIATITTTPSMPYQYVSAMISADNGTVLGYPGGAVRKIIRWSFEKQGLYHPLSTPTPGVMTRGPPPAVDPYIDAGRDGEYDYAPMSGNSPGIWNRQAPDGGLNNQAPFVGVPNYCYVAVKNRGTENAQNVQVTVYESTIPEPTVWPARFQSPGPFRWTPNSNASFDRYSLLAAVGADGDLSNIDANSGLACAIGPTDVDNLVPFDNNLAVRRFEW